MDSISKPKPSDDPHDFVVVAPDAVQVAPAHEEIESLLKDKARAPSAPQVHVEPLFLAGATLRPVDSTFRATGVDDVPVKSRRRSLARRALRAVTALLMAACIGGAAMAWHYHAEAAQRIIAEWAPLFAQKSSPPSEKTGLASSPVLAAAEVDAANASPAQVAPQAEAAAPSAVAATAAPAAAISPDEPQSLEAMARDLANASQEIEQLKASVEQLKASQQQLVAMVSEKAAAQNLRPKKPAQAAPPPRPVAALTPARAPAPPLPPRPYRPAAAPPSAAAAPLPPASAPYVPRQAEPYLPRQAEPQSHTTAETLNDPELVSVPRPPMPLR
jgi:hypothetical protein